MSLVDEDIVDPKRKKTKDPPEEYEEEEDYSDESLVLRTKGTLFRPQGSSKVRKGGKRVVCKKRN